MPGSERELRRVNFLFSRWCFVVSRALWSSRTYALAGQARNLPGEGLAGGGQRNGFLFLLLDGPTWSTSAWVTPQPGHQHPLQQLILTDPVLTGGQCRPAESMLPVPPPAASLGDPDNTYNFLLPQMATTVYPAPTRCQAVP